MNWMCYSFQIIQCSLSEPCFGPNFCSLKISLQQANAMLGTFPSNAILFFSRGHFTFSILFLAKKMNLFFTRCVLNNDFVTRIVFLEKYFYFEVKLLLT